MATQHPRDHLVSHLEVTIGSTVLHLPQQTTPLERLLQKKLYKTPSRHIKVHCWITDPQRIDLANVKVVLRFLKDKLLQHHPQQGLFVAWPQG